MSLNINGKNDASYRYKMPAIESQKIGNGNGCHTMLTNLDVVSSSISCPLKILLKYISLTFGTNCNEKKVTINGHHSTSDIQKAIYAYINSYLLCSSCSVPELIPNVEGKKKRKTLHFRCSACGHSFMADSKSKLNGKINDIIIKYLDKSEWIIKKGMVVEKKEEFDPFTCVVDF